MSPELRARIKRRRRAMHVTQPEAAAAIGLAPSMWGRYERINGDEPPSDVGEKMLGFVGLRVRVEDLED